MTVGNILRMKAFDWDIGCQTNNGLSALGSYLQTRIQEVHLVLLRWLKYRFLSQPEFFVRNN